MFFFCFLKFDHHRICYSRKSSLPSFTYQIYFFFQLKKVLNGQKDLTPGRVIVVNSKDHLNMFGIVLTSKSLRKETYTVLVICDEKDSVWTESQTASFPQEDLEMIVVEPYVKHPVIFCPQRPCGHKVIDVVEKDIVAVTEKKIRVESEAVINDYKKRQMPRFR